MKLSDVMSAMGLAGFAELALLLFLLAFVAVAVDLLRRPRELEALRFMPLDREAERSDQPRENGP